MAGDKIYVGRAKYISTRYGEMCKVWLTPEGVEAINANVDNKGGINLNMTEMREVDRAGNTHVLTVDDYNPDRGRSSGRGQSHAPQRREPQRRDQDNDRRRNYGGRNNGGFGGQPNDNGGHRYNQSDCPQQSQQEPPPMDEDAGAPPFEDEDIPF